MDSGKKNGIKNNTNALGIATKRRNKRHELLIQAIPAIDICARDMHPNDTTQPKIRFSAGVNSATEVGFI